MLIDRHALVCHHALRRKSQSLMTSLKSRPRYYKPEKTSFLVCLVFGFLFCGATWLTLTSVYNQQQITHCEQGWQRACKGLR